MSKGKRLRDRRAKAAAKAAEPPPLAWLNTANEAVGDAFGTEADCAVACAILKMTADILGFSLTPRPVSLWARKPSTNDIAVMGPKATALVPESERHRIEDHWFEGRDTGHMVLTSEQPSMLLDPNLRQLATLGIHAPSISLNIKSTNPDGGVWRANPPGFDLELVYMLDGNDALWDRYESALETHRPHAVALAELVRAGQTAEQIRQRPVRRPS